VAGTFPVHLFATGSSSGLGALSTDINPQSAASSFNVIINYWDGTYVYDGSDSINGAGYLGSGLSNVVAADGRPRSEESGQSGLHYSLVGAGMVAETIPAPPGSDVARLTVHAPATPEVYLMDFGQGALVSGFAHVELDPRLADSIRVDGTHPLRVFVQAEDDPDSPGVVVMNKSATGFDVVERQGGRGCFAFQWQIIGNRADENLPNGAVIAHANLRLERAPVPPASGSVVLNRPVR
jgi:hypothetical protein